MSETKSASRLSSLLKSKRTERVVDLIVVPILLIVSLLLPPASVGARLLDLDLPAISPDEPTEIVGPQGARLNVPAGAVAKRVRVRFDAVGAAELGTMEANSPEILAAKQVPAEVLAFEPFYRFELKGEGPSASQLTLPIPYELAALDLADLYAWDGQSWQWIPSRVSDNGLDLIAELSEIHPLYLVAQTQAQTPRIGFVATQDQAASIPPSAALLSVQGATLAGDGSLANVPGRPNTREDVSVLLRVTNLVDGVVRSDWLDNLLIDTTLTKEHVRLLAEQAAFDGIELDYREADPALCSELTAFISSLGEALHAQGKTLVVVLDPPTADSGYDTGAYDWQALGQIADLVRVRAYAMPDAYAVDGAMDALLRWATDQVDRRKLDLALDASCIVTDGNGIDRIPYREALSRLASELDANDTDGLLLPGESVTVHLADLDSAKLTFDPEAQMYAFQSMREDGTPQTVYLTNAISIARRLQYVTRYALGGASIVGALSPEADKAVATLLDDLPHTVVPPAPRFAYVYTVWSADGDAIGSQVVPVDDASMTWTAPNNPGHYIIKAEISDDGGETVLESVGSLDVQVPTPTFTPTPTNTPTPTPTCTPTPTNTPKPTPKPQASAVQATGFGGGSLGGYFGYGIQAHMLDTGNIDQIFQHITGMGFNWVKQQVEWWRFNPGPGQYNWGSLDVLVDAANRYGVNLLLSVVKAPEWARPGGDDRSVAGPPADPATYATFMQELAARYKGRVKAYEIWNEQNLWYEWGGRGNRLSAAAYVDLLRHAYNAVKSVDPGAIVVSGALTPTGWNDGDTAIDDRVYLEQMYQAGLARYCDAVGAHPSGYNNPPDADWRTYNDPAKPGCKGHPSWFFRGTMESYRNIMVKYGDGGKRIWPTEFGWATTEGLGVGPNPGYEYAGTNSEAEQAAYLVRAFQMGRSWGWVGPMFVWNLNFGPISGAQDEKAKFAIVRPDWSPRPAYAALRDMPK